MSANSSGRYDVHSEQLKNYPVNDEAVRFLPRNDVERATAVDPNVEERGTWGSRIDFILSLLGYSVGLGNIWRFPYMCYKNGGGAFLVPYWLTMFFCGVPLFLLEVSWGQFCSRSSVSCWAIAPILKGAGYAGIIVTSIFSVFFNILLTYILFYFGKSFTLESTLEWGTCGRVWNTENCFNYNNKTLREELAHWLNISINGTSDDPVLDARYANYKNFTSPSDEYFHRRVLQISSGLDNLGDVQWELLVCLLAAWTITILCVVKGVKSSGKVVWFTATFPYIMLTVLLIRGVTLEGASKGIAFYITPRFEYLRRPQVWADAAFQVFYSLGPGWGGLITMGSYSKFRQNSYRDSVIVPICMGMTSFFAGFVVFSVIGFMSHVLQKPVEEVATQGAGLAFVMYPQVVTMLPLSQLWSILFFFMLITVALDTEFVMIETTVTALWDELPQRFKIRRVFLLLGTCLVMFLLGIPFVTQGGMYLLQLADTYTATYTVVCVSILETIAIAWIYGAERFLDDFQFMIGRRPTVLWTIIWRFVTPGILLILFFVACIQHRLLTYGTYVYPHWATGAGFCFSIVSLIAMPSYALFYFISAPKNVPRWRYCFKANALWRPAEDVDNDEWQAFKRNPQYNKGPFRHLASRIFRRPYRKNSS